MNILQTISARKLLITEDLRAGNGGGTPPGRNCQKANPRERKQNDRPVPSGLTLRPFAASSEGSIDRLF
jgi:hypothetical protein